MKTSKIYATLLFFTFSLGFSQMSGNSVYRNYNNENSNSNGEASNFSGFSLTDEALTFKVKVMMNKKADRYSISLGLNEEANTVQESNTNINKRIDSFIEKLMKIGIKKEAIYVDFISETKVYDYTVGTNKAEQFEKGFEIKKNIIINTNLIKNLDVIIQLASEFKIYDIIKVDYLSDNSSQIYDELFEEGLKIANSKKEKYLKSFNKKTIGNPSASDTYAIYTPQTQYKNYRAFESSEFETYYNSSNAIMKKIARKNSTFYYDGISQSGIDKIINTNSPEVGIQYLLTITITYKIDTSI